jgi:hypothetical protein
MTLVTAVILTESCLIGILGALAGLLWIALQRTDQRLQQLLNGDKEITEEDNRAGLPSPRILTTTVPAAATDSHRQWRIGAYID